MQRVVSFSVSLAIWAGLVFACELKAQEILLQDSFENGDAVPDQWFNGAAIPSVEYLYDSGNASNGTRSLGIKKTDKRFSPVAQWVRKFDYEAAALSAELTTMVKARGATKAIVELEYFNLAREMISKEALISIGPKESSGRAVSHNWKRYSGQATIPEGTKQILVSLQMHGSGTVWFDELTFSIESASAATPDQSLKPVGDRVSKAGAEPTVIVTASGAFTRYSMIPPSSPSRRASDGHPLVLVLAGGDGSEENFPFVQSIHSQILKGKYAVAQIIAPPRVVWPIRQSPTQFATTEEAIEAVVDAVDNELPIDRSKVIAIAWSSSGPATYASMLSEKTPLCGALIAMSGFREEDYPDLAKISGRRFYLLHSPKDELTPYSMAVDARDRLRETGNLVEMKDYEGGHGWHGKSVNMIPAAVDWLLKGD